MTMLVEERVRTSGPTVWEEMQSRGVSRRDFVTRTAAAGAGLVIVPRHVLGRGLQAPSDTVNIATVAEPWRAWVEAWTDCALAPGGKESVATRTSFGVGVVEVTAPAASTGRTCSRLPALSRT